jgi:hypothetical protein
MKFTPIKINNNNVKVIIKWLVIVKLCGINIIKLLSKINVSRTEMKSKYFFPSTFMLSNSNCEVLS